MVHNMVYYLKKILWRFLAALYFDIAKKNDTQHDISVWYIAKV